MSSPFPFRTGYVSDYICLSGSLPIDGVTNSVFWLDVNCAGQFHVMAAV